MYSHCVVAANKPCTTHSSPNAVHSKRTGTWGMALLKHEEPVFVQYLQSDSSRDCAPVTQPRSENNNRTQHHNPRKEPLPQSSPS